MVKAKSQHPVRLQAADKRRASALAKKALPELQELAEIVMRAIKPGEKAGVPAEVIVFARVSLPLGSKALLPAKIPDEVWISASQCVDRGGTLIATSAGAGCYIESEGICLPID